MSERVFKYNHNAKYPRVLDNFIASGEKAMAIPCEDFDRQAFLVKSFNSRCHARQRGVLCMSRNGVVYLLNLVALGVDA